MSPNDQSPKNYPFETDEENFITAEAIAKGVGPFIQIFVKTLTGN